MQLWRCIAKAKEQGYEVETHFGWKELAEVLGFKQVNQTTAIQCVRALLVNGKRLQNYKTKTCKINSPAVREQTERVNAARTPKAVKPNKYEDWLADKANSAVFLSSPEWQTLKAEVYKIYPKICMKCKTTKKVMHVDHIKPRKLFPELALSLDNLQVLCCDCNRAKGNKVADYRPEHMKS